ncbi:hypothetical protein [Cupriavidus basilensis]|uniref:Uncharacterized protein n=1 Tax=Cupriavidus basilensis TaxID=68895 RepID=A0A643FXP9_9BURK|nr:hypothetical protein [Cupriavidus basilensis]QOT79899.1 hypothetical protein F7R26_035175 [Cupriavidus basilensis]
MSHDVKRLNDFGGGVHAVGTLDFLMRFWRKSDLPAGPPPHAGALTCPVADSCWERLPQDFAPATIRFDREQVGTHPIISTKLSLGELEIVWLADAQDPDVWMAIDFWKRMKVVPIVLGVGEHGEECYRFFLPTMPADVHVTDEPEAATDGCGDAEPWTSMIAFCEAHGAAFPLVSTRVPLLPRPAGFKAIKYLLCHRDSAN